MISTLKLLGLVLCMLLSACAVSVEQPAGEKVTPGVQWHGTWRATMTSEQGHEIYTVKGAGDDLLVRTLGREDQGADEDMIANVFRFKNVDYLALRVPEQKPGYYLLRVDLQSNTRLRLRPMDRDVVEKLLKRLNLPFVLRKPGMSEELYIGKATFHELMERHADAVFARDQAMSLEKLP